MPDMRTRSQQADGRTVKRETVDGEVRKTQYNADGTKA